jgi:flagellar hook-length control protein FliK
MPQVNINTIDLALSPEKPSSTVNVSNSEQTKTSSFADVMEKHQQQECGKNSQKSGKENNQEPTTTDQNVKNTQDKLKTAEKKGSVSQGDINNDKPLADDVQIENKMAKLSNEALYAAVTDENVSVKEGQDTAQALLSFILASDDVSTEKVVIDGTLKVESKKTDIQAFTASTMKIDTNDQKNNVDSNKDTILETEGATIIQLRETTGAKNGADSLNYKTGDIGHLNESNKVLSEKKIAGLIDEDLEFKSKANFQKPMNNKNLETNTTFSVDKSQSELNKNIDILASGVIDGEDEGVLPEEFKAHTGTIDKKSSINLTKPTREYTLPVKPPVEDLEKVTQPLSQTLTEKELQTIDVKTAEAKSVVRNEQVGSHIFNRESQNNQSQSNSQKGQQQNQQLNKPAETSISTDIESLNENQEEFVSKEQVEVFTDKTSEKVSEKNVLQTQLRETSISNTLSQQSMTFSDEQSMQSQIVNTNADLISIQAAKTAINTHNETISIFRKDFPNEVKEKVMVMINQKLKQLEIRLDPPELGSMHVKLNLQNEQAAVSFVVQNQQAKEALEQNIDKLKDMLAESGVDVGDTNIEQKNQQADDNNSLSQNQNGQGDSQSQETGNDELVTQGANLYKASSSGVDYYA